MSIAQVPSIFGEIHKRTFNGNNIFFDISEHFKVMTEPVEIAHVGPAFQKKYYGKSVCPGSSYQYLGYQLKTVVSHQEVLRNLAKHNNCLCSVTMPGMWSDLLDQPHNECVGMLDTIGNANVFPVYNDHLNMTAATSIFWKENRDIRERNGGHRGWRIVFFSPEKLLSKSWFPGTRFFVRDLTTS